AVERIDAEALVEHERGVHPEHHEGAVGEVDDAHDAEDQRHAHADESVERAGEEAVDDGLHQRPHYLRWDHGGVGMTGFASAASAGQTTLYWPPCTCVMSTGCGFWPLASNLIGPKGVARLVARMASRTWVASADFARLIASAA